MSRNLTHAATLGFAALMLVACSSPRKASERACAKAERYRAKAVWLCPQMLDMDSATARYELPGDSAQQHAAYTQADVDSILTACLQLREALDAERELYAATMAQRSDSAAVPPPAPTRPGAATRAALNTLRRQACDFEPLEAAAGICRARVTAGPGGPLLRLEQLPIDTALRAPCPPALKPTTTVTHTGVASWYRPAFWTLLVITALLVAMLARMVAVHMRTNTPTG